MKRIRVLLIAGIVGVFEYSRPIAEVVASVACFTRFLIEANWSRVKIAVESVCKFLEIIQFRNGTTY